MNDIRRLQKRFEQDPVFHTMVKVIYHQLVSAHLSPSEVREAAMLACAKFEMIHAPVLREDPFAAGIEMKYGAEEYYKK
ncbi:MAG: hypothetical protein ACKOX6_12920 [Bdellovibrio sp.]